MPQGIHVRCKLCGCLLPGWLRVLNRPSGAMLLHHLSDLHPDAVGPYLRRMAAGEDITTVVVEAYEIVEGDG